jgi:hypothetical protein
MHDVHCFPGWWRWVEQRRCADWGRCVERKRSRWLTMVLCGGACTFIFFVVISSLVTLCIWYPKWFRGYNFLLYLISTTWDTVSSLDTEWLIGAWSSTSPAFQICYFESLSVTENVRYYKRSIHLRTTERTRIASAWAIQSACKAQWSTNSRGFHANYFRGIKHSVLTYIGFRSAKSHLPLLLNETDFCYPTDW